MLNNYKLTCELRWLTHEKQRGGNTIVVKYKVTTWKRLLQYKTNREIWMKRKFPILRYLIGFCYDLNDTQDELGG